MVIHVLLRGVYEFGVIFRLVVTRRGVVVGFGDLLGVGGGFADGPSSGDGVRVRVPALLDRNLPLRLFLEARIVPIGRGGLRPLARASAFAMRTVTG